MKNFERTDLLLSLCGLNCGLCPMHLGKHCPGCGGGSGNMGCSIAKCSQEHDKTEYCFNCGEYLCDKYEGIDAYDSFVTHRNQLKDLEKAKKIGLEAYHKEQNEKIKILDLLLDGYNDGRQKTLFSIAVNLLELKDVELLFEEIKNEASSDELSLKEKSKIAADKFKDIAAERNIVLKLIKKPKTV